MRQKWNGVCARGSGRPTTVGGWTLTYIRVKGKWVYLYRAVDSIGATIDFLLSGETRCSSGRALSQQGLAHPAPRVINTDKHAGYPPAIVRLKAEGALEENCRLSRAFKRNFEMSGAVEIIRTREVRGPGGRNARHKNAQESTRVEKPEIAEAQLRAHLLPGNIRGVFASRHIISSKNCISDLNARRQASVCAAATSTCRPVRAKWPRAG
jgi:DDE domain